MLGEDVFAKSQWSCWKKLVGLEETGLVEVDDLKLDRRME